MYRQRRNFPYGDAVVRLVGAVLAEQHDDWIQQNCYAPLTSLENTNGIFAAIIIDTGTQKVACPSHSTDHLPVPYTIKPPVLSKAETPLKPP